MRRYHDPMTKFTDALNAQLAQEFAASQQYIAIAVFYDGQTLPQLAKHFYRQAVEERNHAMIIVQYLLDAQKEVTIPAVSAPRTKFGDHLEPVQLALDQERAVTEQIEQLAQIARAEGDLVGEQFLAWFLKEQLEEMSSMADLHTTVERAWHRASCWRRTTCRASRSATTASTGRLRPRLAEHSRIGRWRSAAGSAEPSGAASEYLMTIRYMHAEGQPVIAARLAERLGVSAATVSEMVTRLVREGLLRVDADSRQLNLTDRGREAAERTFRRHALSEWLLTEVIGLGWADADEEAHHLQHALSDRVTDRVDDLLGRPPTCPHGNPIPRDGHPRIDRPAAGCPTRRVAARSPSCASPRRRRRTPGC